MARKPYRAVAKIDPQALAEFQAGIRRRYTDEQILEALRASAERLGRSPTMKEFAADPEAGMHPQTVIEHFGTWNAAKRAAGLMPRRFATREELVGQLRRLGEELGRTPTAHDIRVAARDDAVEVALLAHVRLARDGASRGRFRRRGRGGAARAGGRAGQPSSRARSAACRGSATGRRRGGRTRRCSPSGRSTACSRRAAARGRRSSTSCASGCSRKARPSRPTGRSAERASRRRRAPRGA